MDTSYIDIIKGYDKNNHIAYKYRDMCDIIIALSLAIDNDIKRVEYEILRLKLENIKSLFSKNKSIKAKNVSYNNFLKDINKHQISLISLANKLKLFIDLTPKMWEDMFNYLIIITEAYEQRKIMLHDDLTNIKAEELHITNSGISYSKDFTNKYESNLNELNILEEQITK